MTRPFSQAAENNKAPIADVLSGYLHGGDLLEIGAGTGQHATWMAPLFPDVRWHPTEQPDNLPALNLWLEDAPSANLEPARILRVQGRWPDRRYDYIYTANTFHIMAAPLVQRCVQRIAEHLHPGALVFIYGPFNLNGTYTSDSNRRFDLFLKRQDLAMGLRDRDWVVTLFAAQGLALLDDHPMPANNRLLVFG